jgi:hypothetical protein
MIKECIFDLFSIVEFAICIFHSSFHISFSGVMVIKPSLAIQERLISASKEIRLSRRQRFECMTKI